MTTRAPTSHPVFRRELRRKSVHILAVLIPLGMVVFGKIASVVLLTLLVVLALGGDVLRAYNYGFSVWVRKHFGSMMRPSELPPPGSKIVINGATWLLLAAWIAAVVLPVSIVAAALAMFLFADAAAGIVGMLVGRTAWPGTHRTVQGSAAFFLIGMVVLLLLPAIPFDMALITMLIATALEALPGPLNDNFRVPIVTAAVLAVLFALSPGETVSLFFAG